MRDFIGNKLEIGDEVIYQKQDYREFSTGLVLRFTKCYVYISTDKDEDGNWKGLDDGGKYKFHIFRQTPDQLIKVIKNHG